MRISTFVLAALLAFSPAFAQAPARSVAAPTLTIQVSDPAGLPLGGVQVTAQGPLSRDGMTSDEGSIRFANMRPGTYRLRFVRPGSVTLERDVTVRANEPLLVDVALSAAPAPPPPPQAPEPVRPAAQNPADRALGPPADPKTTAIPTFLEKNFIGREGRKDSPLGCTTTGNGTLVQIREAVLNQSRDDADEWIYVVAGEGTLRLGGSEQHLQAGTFSLIPHSVSHGLLPAGRNPLIYVSILSGYKPC